MSSTQHVLAVHPTAPETAPEHRLARGVCIDACFDCAQACRSGADAWLDEQGAANIRTCQRAQENCADMCLAAVSILPRLGSPGTDSGKAFMGALIQACMSACRACQEQCEPHLAFPHCRLCREACARCEQACADLLDSLRLTRP
jgi:hypothetical protein